MATKVELKNKKGAYYVGPDGSIISDSTATIQPGSIGITVTPSDVDLDAIDIVFPEDVQVEPYSKKKGTGMMSGTVMALLKTLWVDEISQMRYDEDDDKLLIDCTLTDDEDAVDDDEVGRIVDKFKEARKEHNALCKPKDSDDDGDSNPPADSDGDDNSDSNKQKQKQPKKQPQKRAPRKDNESASGQVLEFVDRDQADRDTHATLVAIGGEEFAKNFNGLIWDEASQTYKDA